MDRSSRRNRSREPEDDVSSDTGTNTRLRRRMRSMAAEYDGADTDASSSGHPADEPQRRPVRRGRARKAIEEGRNFSPSTEYIHSSRYGDKDGVDDDDKEKDADIERRQRSLSNVSNTSSTSVSSLTSESLTQEQCRVRAVQQLAELEQKKKMVEDGTLAEFCRRVAAFKEERNRLLQTAELHKNLQLKNGQDLYNFEVQRAYNLWQNDHHELKNKLLTKVDSVMAKLQAEMKALSEPETKCADIAKTFKQKSGLKSTDKPVATKMDKRGESKKRIEPEQEEGEVIEPVATSEKVSLCKRRKMDSTVRIDSAEKLKLLPEETMRLPFDTFRADIAAIVGNIKQTEQALVDQLSNNRNVPFKLEQRRLLCGKDVFEDGDEVHVLLPLMHEDYTGTISSITDDAIYIKLASGHKVRILLPHIEFRRCELKPALRSSLSTGSLHNLGWPEYDTHY